MIIWGVCGLNIVNFIIVVRSCQNDSYETDGMLSLFHRIRLDPRLLFSSNVPDSNSNKQVCF